MSHVQRLLILLAAVASCFVAERASAYSDYSKYVAENYCSTCHVTGGYARNGFGAGWAAGCHTYVSSCSTFAATDSDGDGKSNGDELNTGTSPAYWNDECYLNIDGCSSLSTCSDSQTAPGNAVCTCDAGYAGNGHGEQGCTDVDECLGTTDCGEHSSCKNVPGSYECPCHGGYYGDGKPGLGCTFVNHCEEDFPPPCHPTTTCTPIAAGPHYFVCSACPPGYTGDGRGANGCTDVNECAVDNGGCDPLTRCDNTPGSRTCTSCPIGYEGDGETGCVPYDQCAAALCSPLAVCDLDETDHCRCLPGYEGDGKTCTDVDECANDNPCGEHASCVDLIGGHVCTCDAGFGADAGTCTELPTCENTSLACGERARCTDTRGMPACECKPGFEGKFPSCTPREEPPEELVDAGVEFRENDEPDETQTDVAVKPRTKRSGTFEQSGCSVRQSARTSGWPALLLLLLGVAALLRRRSKWLVVVASLFVACTTKLPPEEELDDAGVDAGRKVDDGRMLVEPSEDANVVLPNEDASSLEEVDAGPSEPLGCSHSRECSPSEWCNPMNRACEARAAGEPIYFTDVIKVLTDSGCRSCHTEGAEADVTSEQGDLAIVLDTVNGAYAALVGEGLTCWKEARRLCVDDPASSRFATKALLKHDGAGQQTEAFGSWEDERLQTILRWIARGAPRESGAPVQGNHAYEPGEACDLGDQPPTTCAYGLGTCQLCSAEGEIIEGTGPKCGDGHLDEEFEACDDGNTVTEETDEAGGYTCGADCTWSQGACGGLYQACCDTEQGPTCKFAGNAVCKTFQYSEWDPPTTSCVECGDDGEACCGGNTCHGEGHCYPVDGGTCYACGGENEPSCGEWVDLGGHVFGCAEGLTRHWNGTCVPCGGYGEACCAVSYCDPEFQYCQDRGYGYDSACDYSMVCQFDDASSTQRCFYPHYGY